MNKRIILSALAITSFLFVGAGCKQAKNIDKPVIDTPKVEPVVIKEESTKTTILVSSEDPAKYCNGQDMDSDGYKKTIINEKTIVVSSTNQTVGELAKTIAVSATTGQCQSALKQSEFSVANNTIHISQMDGWAGVSIAMCSCKPQVEVNLLRLQGVNSVIWDNK